MKQHLEDAFETIDAAVFTGDFLLDTDSVSVMMDYINSWRPALGQAGAHGAAQAASGEAMNKEQKSEAHRLAEKLHNAIHLLDCDFADDIDTNDLKLAAMELESLHTRVQGLEAKEAKPAAPLNVWQQAIDAELVSTHLGIAHNDATFEGAQKAIHELICWHIGVAIDPRTNGGKVLFRAAPVVLPEPRVTQSAQAPATAIQERDKFEQLMAASYPNLSFDRHSYQYDHNRFAQYKVQWLWEGWQARAALDASDHIEQPLEMVAASAELNLDDYYCKGCGRIGEIEELSAMDESTARPART